MLYTHAVLSENMHCALTSTTLFSHSWPHFRMQPLEFTSFWCCIRFTELSFACLLLPLKSVTCFLESFHIQCYGTIFVIKDKRDKLWNDVVRLTQDPGRCSQMSYKWLRLFLPLKTELRGAVLVVVRQGCVTGGGKNKLL